MLEKPKRAKQLNNQDRQLPATIQELINRYDLENKDIYKFLDYLVDNINNKTATGEGSVTGDTIPIGAIIEWNSDITPVNWLLCNGQEVSRTEYAELFQVLGTTCGEGDGSTTFNLPNRKGNVAVGKDESDTDFSTLGKTGGEKEHTLTIDETPKHEHYISSNAQGTSDGENYLGGYSTSPSTDLPYALRGQSKVEPTKYLTSSTGGSQPHNNLQPYITTNFIIKAKQSAGVVATVVDNLKSNSPTDGLSANQGRILNEKIIGTVLYEDEVGTTENVTLSDNKDNYDDIEIQGYLKTGGSGNIGFSSGKMSARLKSFNISMNRCVSDDSIQFCQELLTIEGASCIRTYGNFITYIGLTPSNHNKNKFHITKITGYKY